MNRPHKFKNRDITRCLKSALAAGVSNPSVTVRLLPGRTEYVVGGEVTARSNAAEPQTAGRAAIKKKAPVGGTANRARPA